IDAELAERADKFREQVSEVLREGLIAEGDQVLNASLKPALIAEFATVSRPDPRSVEKILDDLRRENPAIIDLRPLKRDSGYGLALSAFIKPGNNESDYTNQLQTALGQAAAKQHLSMLPAGATPLGHSLQPALTLDLLVVEEP